MRSLKNLKINESIRRRKLVYDEDWMDIFGRCLVYLLSVTLIYSSIVVGEALNTHSENDLTFGIIFIVVASLSGTYTIYRAFVEKRLIKIDSIFTAKEIKTKLLLFAVEEGYEIYRESGYLLIFNETIGLYGDTHKKSRIIFVRDNAIFFTVIQDNYRTNRPVYTTHLFLKRAFKKLLN